MWARRCGAPPTWPSRIKVLFFSAFGGTVGLSIYLYMSGSNISYLQLDSPASEHVLCLEKWPQRSHAVEWSNPGEWIQALFAVNNNDLDELRQQHNCELAQIEAVRCENIVVPVTDINRPIALAMGDSFQRYDILSLWARFFLCMTFAIWAGMTIHDLALIGRAQKEATQSNPKDFILDVSGVNEHCPSIRAVWRSLAGVRLLKRMSDKDTRPHVQILGLVCSIVLAPLVLLWNLLVFNFIIIPLLLLAFMRYPIRMSRAWVFMVSCACSLYGLAMTSWQLAYIFNPDIRPHYAVTFSPQSLASTIAANSSLASSGSTCTCGCDYPVNFNVCMNLTMIGFVTILKSIFIAFRCLKGLRRAQWANLLSVLFPVPITIYQVDWRQPDGKPIRHRVEGVPVQDEVAFDPFAMMDEQPDSKFRTVHLEPVRIHRIAKDEHGRVSLQMPTRQLHTPNIPLPNSLAPKAFGSSAELNDTHFEVEQAEYIGCCGFPWPTGGRRCVLRDPELAALMSEKGSSPSKSNTHLVDPRDIMMLDEASPSVGSTHSSVPPGHRGGVSLNLKDIEVQGLSLGVREPRGRGGPGMMLSPREVPRPHDHSPMIWGRVYGGESPASPAVQSPVSPVIEAPRSPPASPGGCLDMCSPGSPPGRRLSSL